ncbi:MAG TPA: GNAT family N-acetyltransferase [Desulfomonilaceae bacterium]|nr:GNAT family N-acetyltransferase [Desulfomonilaceae bacterium]
MRPRFRRIDIDSVTDEQLAAFPDRIIHQTRPWVNFLERTLDAEPVLAVLEEDDRVLGYFTGLIAKEFGFRILGSPFPGWSTTYMGFNLLPGVRRAIALEALADFAFKDLKCDHLEIMDRQLKHEDATSLGFNIWNFETLEVDLSPSEESIFANMKHQCRNCIRKAERSGVRIEEANDAEFADDYYEQLTHVFAAKGLLPPFDVHRVRDLIHFLLPTGRLLLLRARNQEGICIATGIFPAMNVTMYAWGSASWRQYSNVRPNEAIFWHAMKYWKRRGVLVCDLVGAVHYKLKYGGRASVIPWVRKSRTKAIAALRTTAESLLLKHPRSLGRLLSLTKQLFGHRR